MPAIIAVIIVIIFVVVKCESAFPTQNYYKKDVTNEEYKRVLDDCESAKNTAIDWELYKNPKNYSHAGHLGEYAKDTCFKEKGFIKGGKPSKYVEDINSNVNEIENPVLEENTELKDKVTTELNVRNDIAYSPNEEKPFTGRYETYYPNGNKKGVAYLRNGKFDGLMTLWDQDGQKNFERNFKNGIETPIKTHSKNNFGLFRTEAETVRNKLECPLSVDDDIVKEGSLYGGDLYGCILGTMQTVKWFINENANSNKVYNVKFLWNDWFIDRGYGKVHSDRQEAQRALDVIIKMYAPEKAKELNKTFFDTKNKTIVSDKFILKYTFDRGPAIDERMIVVTSK